MSDLVEQFSLQRIEDLRRRKAELEEKNSGLASKLQDGEQIKTKLKEARKDSQKLLHHREKLKSKASKHLKVNLNTEQTELETSENKEEKIQVTTIEKAENLTNGHITEGDEINEDDPVQLRRQLNAFKIQNASLIREKRKTEEQKDSLVQELVDLSNKYENQQTLCTKLKDEIGRLSTFLGEKSSNRSFEKEEDIEAIRAQFRANQEDLNRMQEQINILQRANGLLRSELNEARAVIRDLRKIPAFEVYQAPVYQPTVLRAYDEDRYGYGPSGYRMVRTGSGGYLAVDPEYRPRVPRSATTKRNLFKPDLTAVIDHGKEVEDLSLMSSKSF